MTEILIICYEQCIENNMATHITTSLTVFKLENCYENRVLSRLGQMFNLIAFDKDELDKRN